MATSPANAAWNLEKLILLKFIALHDMLKKTAVKKTRHQIVVAKICKFFSCHVHLNNINGDCIDNSDSLKNMLHASFGRKKVEYYGNHSDHIKNVAERPARKNFAYQRKTDDFKIGKNNVKIGILLKTQKNGDIKKGAKDIQNRKRNLSQKVKSEVVKLRYIILLPFLQSTVLFHLSITLFPQCSARAEFRPAHAR